MSAQSGPVLTNFNSVRSLPHRIAQQGFEVVAGGVVTYSDPTANVLFVQDDSTGVFVWREADEPQLHAGQRILIHGVSDPGLFAPIIRARQITVQGEGMLPKARETPIQQALSGREDSQWVELEAVLQQVSELDGHTYLKLAVGTSRLPAVIPVAGQLASLGGLVDSVVRVRGACLSDVSTNRELRNVRLAVPDPSQIAVVESGPANAFALPVSSVASLRTFRAEGLLSHRVHVQGVVTLHRPGEALYIEDKTGGLYVNAPPTARLQIGDSVDVVGFQVVNQTAAQLEDVLVEKLGEGVDLEGAKVQAIEADQGGRDAKLLRITGRLTDFNRTPQESVFVLQDEDQVFDVVLPRGYPGNPRPEIANGSVLEVKGVCSVFKHFDGASRGFRIYTRQDQDIRVLQSPPWWTPRRIQFLLAGITVASLAGLLRFMTLNRRVREQTRWLHDQHTRESLLQDRYRKLFEKAADMVCILDRDGIINSVNPAGTTITGFAEADLLGRSFTKLLPPLEARRVLRRFRRIARGAASVPFSTEVLGADGGLTPIEISLQVILNPDQTVEGVQAIARDITERRRSENQSRSFSRLAEALGAARDAREAAKAILDAADELLCWDAAFLHLYTPDHKRVVPILNFDLVVGERREVDPPRVGEEGDLYQSDRHVLAHGATLILRGSEDDPQLRMVSFGDSEKRSASLMYVPIRSAGKILGTLSIQSYSTNAYSRAGLGLLQSMADYCGGTLERIWAEVEKQRLVMLIENSNDLIGLETIEGRMLYLNKAGCDLLGQPSSIPIASQSAEAFHTPESWRHFTEVILPAVQRDGAWRGESKLRNLKTMKVVEVQRSFFAVRQPESNAPYCLASITRDISDQRRAQEALRLSEERFSKAFRSSPIPLSITTFEDGKYLEVNHAFLELLGFEHQEVIGRSSLELGIWPDSSHRSAMTEQIRRDGRARELELNLRTKSGETKTLLASLESIQLAGEMCIIGILFDITARLNLEAQLRHAQKLEAIGQLASGVAHDFNNIMTIIQGHATLLQSMHSDPLRLEESLREILQAADHATKLTRQLLMFSRKQVMQPRALDLNSVISGLGTMLPRLLGEDVALLLDRYPTEMVVMADAGMLEQVLVNLAVNARDAMPGGGTLTIRTRPVFLTGENGQSAARDGRRGRFACLSVSDTGFGMDEKTQARIFEPFFTTKEAGKGTGLGLATVYGIVQQHEGWIEVRSSPGAGATFELYLPYHESPTEPPASEAASPPSPRGTETILVVEDEDSLRSLARQVIQRNGYSVLTAASGLEALEIWKANSARIDLLFTDMVMPMGISGKELAERLLKEKPSLRIVYTSGYSIETAGRTLNLDEGINFLQKPYLPKQLLELLRTALNQTEPVRPL